MGKGSEKRFRRVFEKVAESWGCLVKVAGGLLYPQQDDEIMQS